MCSFENQTQNLYPLDRFVSSFVVDHVVKAGRSSILLGLLIKKVILQDLPKKLGKKVNLVQSYRLDKLAKFGFQKC